tara:strand:- start:1725 stop:3359 length:1635 start_codon:yes stop_codon:yes gene_type:complete
MPLANATISSETLSGEIGTQSDSGIVYLTITPDIGYAIGEGALRIGAANQTSLNEWTGGNVTNGIVKVIFTYNDNGTATAAVHYNSIDWSTATDLYVDIDGKVTQIRDEPPVIQQDCCAQWNEFMANASAMIQITHPTVNVVSTLDAQGNVIQVERSNNGEIYIPNLCAIRGCFSGFAQTQARIRYGAFGDWEELQTEGGGYYTGNPVQNYQVGRTCLGDVNAVIEPWRFLLPGQYYIDFEDVSFILEDEGANVEEACPIHRVVVELSVDAQSSNSVSNVVLDSPGFDNELLPTASMRSLTVNHGAEANFELQLFDQGAGTWYDFERATFSPGVSSSTVNSPGTRFTRYNINFPAASVTSRYKVFIEPLSGTRLTRKVPTAVNPIEVMQRVNNTITLSLKSTNSQWGSFTTKTLTGRPNTKPITKRVDTLASGYTTAPSGAFNNVYFSIAAEFTAGGGKTTVTQNRGPAMGDLSTSKDKDFIVSYDTQETTIEKGFVRNEVLLSRLSHTYSGTTLTVTGYLTVGQFGSTSETFYIDIDNFITLS